MTVSVGVRGLRFMGRVGWQDEERRMSRPLLVDVEIGVDYDGSGELSGTVDLEAVVRTVTTLEGKTFRLLEDLASVVAGAAVGLSPRVRWARVRVHKLSPPLPSPVDAEFVEVVCERDG
ncbi:MAG: dihydroneopterin aldolase [Candidatus Acetothermia bacterium]|nr:dihydroneopterin aldolase [Candidatus Acetothermia bacterium]